MDDLVFQETQTPEVQQDINNPQVPVRQEVVPIPEETAEQRAFKVAAVSDESFDDAFFRTRLELLQTGQSELAAELEAQFAQEEATQLQEQLRDTILSGGDVKEVLSQARSNQQRDTIDRAFDGSLSKLSDSRKFTPEELRELDEHAELTILKAVSGHPGLPDSSNTALDFMSSILVPLEESRVITRAAEKLRIRDEDGDAFVLGGSASNAINEAYFEILQSGDLDEAKRFVTNVVEAFEFAMENPGVGAPSYNTYAMYVGLNEVLSRDPDNSDELLRNIVDVIDFTYVASILGRGIKVGAKAFKAGTPIADVHKADPAAASDIIRESAKDKAQTGTSNVKGLGVDENELVENVGLSKTGNDNKAGTSKGTLEADVNELDNIKAIAEEVDGSILAFSDKNPARSSRWVVQKLNEAKGISLREADTAIDWISETTAIARPIYGRSAQKGFSSLGEAYSKGFELVPDPSVLNIYQRGASGNLEKVKIPDNIVPESVAVQEAKVAQITDNIRSLREEKAVLDDKAALSNKEKRRIGIIKRDIRRGEQQLQEISPFTRDGEYFFETQIEFRRSDDAVLTYGNGQAVGGLFQETIRDVASRFPRNEVLATNRFNDLSLGLESALVRDLKKEFQGLKVSKDNQDALKAVELGGKEERVLKKSDFIAKGWDGRAWDKYQTLVRTFDAMFMLNDRRLRNSLRRENFQHLQSSDGLWNGFVKRVDPFVVRGSVSEMYDPVTRSIRTVDPDYIDDLYAHGGYAGRLKYAESQKVQGGSKTVDYAIIDPRNGQLPRALPSRVLRKIPGYYPRIYKDKFFVQRTLKSGANTTRNGSRVANRNLEPDTIGTAKSRKDAEATVARMLADDPDGIYDYTFKLSDDLDTSTRSGAELDLARNNGQLFFSERGEHLKNLTSGLESDILDPLESIAATARKISKTYAMEPYLRSAEAEFVRRYGDTVLLPNPVTGKLEVPQLDQIDALIQSRGNAALDAEVASAKARARHHNFQKGVVGTVERNWRGAMMYLASHFDNITGGRSSRLLLNDRVLNNDPSRVMRSLGFQAFIVYNPLRQLFMQGAQSLYLAGVDPGYVFGKMYRDGVAVTMQALAARNGRQTNIASVAKKLGVDNKEAEAVVDAVVKSGVLDSVDAHQFVNNGLRSVLGRESVPVAAVSSLSRNLKAVGFGLGEQVNLTNSWMVAYRKLKNSGAIKGAQSIEDRARISSLARDYALSMTTSGALAYQRGYLSMMLQFMSFSHKAWLGVLPEFLGGNKAFSSAQKAKIFASQVALFGATGAGFTGLAQWGIENFYKGDPLDPDSADKVAQLMAGGLVDYSFNRLLESITEEEGAGVSVSGSIAPLNDPLFTVRDVLVDVFRGETDVAAAFLGPSSSVVSKIQKATEATVGVMRVSDGTLQDIGDKLEPWLEIASGYSNYTKARFAAKHGGFDVGNQGLPVISATSQEAFMKGLFGTQTYAEIDFFGHLDISKESAKRRIREDARITYNNLNRALLNISPNLGPDERAEEILEVIRYNNVIHSGYSDAEVDILRQEFIRLSNNAIDTGEEDLFINILNSVYNGNILATDANKERLRHASFLTDEQRLELEEVFNIMIEEKELLRGDSDDAF
jgi:hypothetical protein